MMYHTDCYGTVQPCNPLFDPREPADPDRHGNRRYTWKCSCCGERTTATHRKWGGWLLEEDFEYGDDIGWLVPL